MNFISEHFISSSHPCLEGHFPGNPVVPGVLILEEIISAVHKWLPDSRIEGFNTVKFLQPLYPNNHFTVQLQEKKSGVITFNCHLEKTLLNTGTLTLHSTQEST